MIKKQQIPPLFKFIWAKSYIIIALFVVSLTVAIMYLKMRPEKEVYEASTKIAYVRDDDSINSFVDLVDTKMFKKHVLSKADIDEKSKNEITITYLKPLNSRIILITVSGSNEKQVLNVINAVIIESSYNFSQVFSVQENSFKQVDTINVKTSHIANSKKKILLFAGFMGVIMGCLVVCLMYDVSFKQKGGASES